MAEATLEPPPQQTTLQAEIVKKTAAAVQDTGFDAGFDKEVEAAIAKDSAAADAKAGKPAAAAAATPPEVSKAAAKPEANAPAFEIPKELLGEKAKPAGEPRAEAQPTADDREKFIKEQTAGLSTKAADRFRALESKKFEAEQKASRLPELEKKLAEAEKRLTSAVDTSEVERYKKQVDELDEIVKRRALADHPKFKEHYDSQIEKEVAMASKLVKKEVSSEVEALMSLPETAQRNRRLNEIIGELEPLEASKFQAAIDRADRLSTEKQAELSNWKTNSQRIAEMTQAEQKQTAEQRQRTIDTAMSTAEKRLTEKGIELFLKVDGNDAWNKSVDERMANIRKLADAQLKPEDMAEMAAWAMAGDGYRRLFLTQRHLVQKLQNELAELKGGEPDIGEAGAADTGEESGSMIDIVTRAAQKMGTVR